MTEEFIPFVYELDTAAKLALRKAAKEMRVPIDVAEKMMIRDWLIGHGYLELPEAENDNEA